jgi:hypothetical protein
MITRRNVLKAGIGILGALTLPLDAFASVVSKKPRGPFTIGDIISISFESAKDYIVGKNKGWATHKLSARKPVIQPFGVVAHYNGKDYEIQQLCIPVRWTKEDDAKNPEENQKIALAANLIEKVLEAHDDLLLDFMGDDGVLLVPKHYRYQLSEIMITPDGKCFCALLRTAYAIVKP